MLKSPDFKRPINTAKELPKELIRIRLATHLSIAQTKTTPSLLINDALSF